MSAAPSYEPRPGTVAFRALAYMETLPPGSEVMSSALAEAIGAPPNNVTPCLEAALQAGRLFRRQRDDHVRSPFFWSLTDRSAQPRAPRARVEVPVFVPNVLPNGAAHIAAPHCGHDTPSAVCASAHTKQIPPRSPVGRPMGIGQPAAAGPAEMRIALWDDGTLHVRRDPADLVLFTVAETRQLVAYLKRVAGDV